jgi:DNA-binding CsgD family transcriptional regulator
MVERRRKRGAAPGPAPPENLRAARFALSGEEYAVLVFPVASSGRGDRWPALTKAEAEVADLVVRGYSNAEIAAFRSSSPRTVANQLQAIYRKLGVGSRVELAHAFGRSG